MTRINANHGLELTPAEIRDLRKARRMSVDAFAGILGLTGKHRGFSVYRWEMGLRKPSYDMFTKMENLRLRGHHDDER